MSSMQSLSGGAKSTQLPVVQPMPPIGAQTTASLADTGAGRAGVPLATHDPVSPPFLLSLADVTSVLLIAWQTGGDVLLRPMPPQHAQVVFAAYQVPPI